MRTSSIASKTVALVGALDTKGAEYAFVKAILEAQGLQTFVIDSGVLGSPTLAPDITRAEVARAGGADIAALVVKADRGKAVEAMSRGLTVLLPQLLADSRFDGVLALGGTGGTSVVSRALRALPLGIPKVIVSTVAGGDVSAYVGVSDIVMIPSIVDVAGINRISRGVLARAAGAVVGMLETDVPTGDDKPLIAASMFGNTTEAVETARAIFEAQGYEVLVFHATGNGGRTMESLIETGQIAGVFDLTTTELADELAGGVFTAGPHRLEAVGAAKIPAIVAPGCLDMVNFGAPETVPSRYAGRLFYQHNANVTLMRTNVEENAQLGAEMAANINAYTAPVTVLLPLRGLSIIGAEGGAFHWPDADAALFAALKRDLSPDIPVVEIDAAINDPVFAERAAQALLDHLTAVAA
ncbi:MAG: Tm-1-like ATP-binding domain-containing protein [Armatimonadota bacterium]